MTIDYFIKLARYNSWANKIAGSWLENITDRQWTTPVVSSFESIELTAIHTAGAEMLWLDRWNRVPVDTQVYLTDSFQGTKKDLLTIWGQASEALEAFISGFPEQRLKDILQFRRINGDLYEMPYYQAFGHVFNHSTYHRGQLVTLLRQVGFTAVASTDLVNYFRTH